MQRIHNFAGWQCLADGVGMDFAGERPRVVRLEVNAAQETALYVEEREGGEIHFLALVKGRDTIEFTASGAFTLRAEGGDVNVYTADGNDVSLRLDAPASFTKIVERRKRNPELEQIVAVMSRNMEHRLAQTAREIEGRLARSLPAGTNFDANKGVPGNGEQGAGASGSQAGAKPASGAPSETGGGREGQAASENGGSGLQRGAAPPSGPGIPERKPAPDAAHSGEPGRRES